jgi:hypothetical protein
MGDMRSLRGFLFTAVLLAGVSACATASTFGAPSSGYSPRVPISALARPMAAFDPSRLQISSLVSVGTGWGGNAQALQVTSLTYKFDAPVLMRVSLGNAWGPQMQGRSSFFLEGLDLAFRPSANTIFQIRYQDVRSPLQYGSSPYFAPDWAR